MTKYKENKLIKNCFTCTHHDHRKNYCHLGNKHMGHLQTQGVWVCVRWVQDPNNIVYETGVVIRKP